MARKCNFHSTPPNTACTRRVGVAAFSSSFLGSRLVPAKWMRSWTFWCLPGRPWAVRSAWKWI